MAKKTDTEETPQAPVEPKPFARNEKGLIEGVEYKYKEDGRIDWEAMFNPEYYVYPDGDPSRDPLLKVDGLRDLAELRGIEKKDVSFSVISEQMVVCMVTLRFIPNYEDPVGRIWSALADATPINIGSSFAKYLSAIAETRATGRCIREALGIRLCSFEEVCKDDLGDEEAGNRKVEDTTLAAIRRQMEIKNVDEKKLLEKIREKHPDINSLADMTQAQAAQTLTWLNKQTNAKTGAKNV